MKTWLFWSGPDFDIAAQLAVASAALYTPQTHVTLITDLPSDHPGLAPLTKLDNLTVSPLRPERILTPPLLEVYHRTQFIQHRSDIIRFALLAEHGGVYLDTDTLTRRPLTELPPIALFYDGKIVNTGVMRLPAGHPALVEMLEALATISEQDLAVYQSIVYIWTRIVLRHCDPGSFPPVATAFPVHWKQWQRLFDPAEPELVDEQCAVLHHYGYFSRERTRDMDVAWLEKHDCAFARVALPVARKLAAATNPIGTANGPARN